MDNLIGKTIRIDHMEDNLSGEKYKGRTGVVQFVDDMGDLHGTWGCLAVIPRVDKFTILDN